MCVQLSHHHNLILGWFLSRICLDASGIESRLQNCHRLSGFERTPWIGSRPPYLSSFLFKVSNAEMLKEASLLHKPLYLSFISVTLLPLELYLTTNYPKVKELAMVFRPPEETGTQGRTIWWWRQRLEGWSCKMRNAEVWWQSPEARKKSWDNSPSQSPQGTNPVESLISDFCSPAPWKANSLLF